MDCGISNWIECEKCNLWRRAPSFVDVRKELKGSWECNKNRWNGLMRCYEKTKADEFQDDEEDI